MLAACLVPISLGIWRGLDDFNSGKPKADWGPQVVLY